MSTDNRRVKAARLGCTTRSQSTSETSQVGSGQASSDFTSMEGILARVSCGFCGIHIEDQSINCISCSRKYHSSTQCTGLKALTIQCLQEEEDTALQYTCTNCRCLPVPLGATGGSDSGEWKVAVGQVLEIVKSMASNMADMSRSVNMLLQNAHASNNSETGPPAAPVPQVSGGVPISRNDLYTEMHEFEERKKRVSSVVVRGTNANSVPEFTATFKLVYESIMHSPPQIASVHCINAESKLFRVTLTEKNARVQLMNVARNLKDIPAHKNVYISRDLTKMQRTEIAAKRASRPRRQPGEAGRSTAGEVSNSANATPPVSGSNATPIINPVIDHGRLGSAPHNGGVGGTFQ